MKRLALPIICLALLIAPCFFSLRGEAAQAVRCYNGFFAGGYAESWYESTAIEQAKAAAEANCWNVGGVAGTTFVTGSNWIGGNQYPAWAEAKCCCHN